MLLFMVMPALFGGFGNLKLPLNIFIYIIFENYLLNTLKLFSEIHFKLLLFGIKIYYLMSFVQIFTYSCYEKLISRQFIQGIDKNQDNQAAEQAAEEESSILDELYIKASAGESKNIKSFHPQLGPYLAGLIEGDGHIYVPSSLYGNNGKRRYCFIRICFSDADRTFAHYLKSKLGGFIVDYNTYVTLNIYAFRDLVVMVNLINGNMRTPKIEALSRLIIFLNTHYPLLQVNSLKELDSSPINSNSWLAGISDADGNFNINITTRSKKQLGRTPAVRVSINFRLELRTLYPNLTDLHNSSYYGVMCAIADYFGVKVYYRERFLFGKLRCFYTVIAHNFHSHKVVADYFYKFPLFSSKYINYTRWLAVHHMQLKNEHLTLQGLNACRALKNDFNRKLSAKSINFKNLDTFYI